jgi:NADH:ubiquinone oxidoreductase subunit D
VLCQQINRKSVAILNENKGSDYERYLKNLKHIQNSDRIISECFDDWRRSSTMQKLMALQYHELLIKEQIEQLSDETQVKLNALKQLQR